MSQDQNLLNSKWISPLTKHAKYDDLKNKHYEQSWIDWLLCE